MRQLRSDRTQKYIDANIETSPIKNKQKNKITKSISKVTNLKSKPNTVKKRLTKKSLKQIEKETDVIQAVNSNGNSLEYNYTSLRQTTEFCSIGLQIQSESVNNQIKSKIQQRPITDTVFNLPDFLDETKVNKESYTHKFTQSTEYTLKDNSSKKNSKTHQQSDIETSDYISDFQITTQQKISQTQENTELTDQQKSIKEFTSHQLAQIVNSFNIKQIKKTEIVYDSYKSPIFGCKEQTYSSAQIDDLLMMSDEFILDKSQNLNINYNNTQSIKSQNIRASTPISIAIPQFAFQSQNDIKTVKEKTSQLNVTDFTIPQLIVGQPLVSRQFSTESYYTPQSRGSQFTFLPATNEMTSNLSLGEHEIMTPTQEIRCFDVEDNVDKIDWELLYKINLEFKIQYNSTPISQDLRQKLIKRVHQICNNYNIQRTTFFKTIYCFDRVMMYQNSPDPEFTILVILCIMLKNEEAKHFNLMHISNFVDNRKTLEQVKVEEQNVLNQLRWKLNTPNLIDFLNLVTYQWDQYLKKFSSANHKLYQDQNMFFREPYENSALLYQQTVAIGDACIYFQPFKQFSDMLLALSIVYTISKVYLGLTDLKNIKKTVSLKKIKFSDFEIYFEGFLQSIDPQLKLYDLDNCFSFIKHFFIPELWTHQLIIKCEHRTLEELYSILFISSNFFGAIQDKVKLQKNIKTQIN